MLKYISIFLFWATFLSVDASYALNISVDRSDLGPFGKSIFIYLDGEFEDGDASQFSKVLEGLNVALGERVHIVLNSPGGSVIEGIKIGETISRYDSSTNVGERPKSGEVSVPAICASACVLAYLGGDYRFLSKGSILGVHRFVFGDSNEISIGSATAISQLISADIVRHIRDMRAEPELFELMVNVPETEI